MPLLTFLLVGLQTTAPIATPYWQRQPLTIAVQTPAAATRWRPVELKVDAQATFDNPFDPEDVALDAKILPPTGEPYSVPGFFTRDYRRTGDQFDAVGAPGWRVRFCPTLPGRYQIQATLRDRTGKAAATALTLEVADASGTGFTRRSPRDRRFFEHDDGTSFFPIGVNIGWGSGLSDYEKWLPRYGAQGVNLMRLWLSPDWTTFAVERTGKPAEGKGLGQYDLQNLQRLEEALDIAERHGIKAQLCFESYNILRDQDAHPYWEKTPHNRDNGGPLRIWSDFWTSRPMERFYQAKLRYLVARFGARPSVFAWEFWNEVDIVRDFNEDVVRAWHVRMGRYLRSIDPSGRLIATSFGSSDGYKSIDLIPELDFVQTHHYGPDPVAAAVGQHVRKTAWGKPHLMAEVGTDAAGSNAERDPRGLQTHDPLWASVAVGMSGTAMPWWWDSYIDPKGLYPLFGAVSRFVQGIDFPAQGFRTVWPKLSYLKAPKPLPRGDVVAVNGPVSWERSKANRPQTVRLVSGRWSGDVPLSGLLHGVQNHPDLHNPVSFKMTLDRPCRFHVQVDEVSGHGGARLRFFLDEARVMTRDFADPDATKTESLGQYVGAYSILVPAGTHTVRVVNDGADWMRVGYRLEGAVALSVPPLVGFATVGENVALVWLRSANRTWRNAILLNLSPDAVPATVLRLPGLSSGRWNVEFWDTWTGRATRRTVAKVGLDGALRLELPPIRGDIALKVLRAVN